MKVRSNTVGARLRVVLGPGTAQRNLSAALLVAGQNFADDPDVLAGGDFDF